MPPTTPVPRAHYRPDIDGLRAIAILAVLLYHAGAPQISGGFVGVDIFFVISGFLIASIVLREVRTKTFSILGFLGRRVRRIMPALMTVMVVTVIAAHFLPLYPLDTRKLGGAILSQSIFSSNVYFMTADDYFDQSSTYSPLLHTWTLSVEEQFYLIFPLLVAAALWIVARREQRGSNVPTPAVSTEQLLVWAVAALSFASFAASVWLVDGHPHELFTVPQWARFLTDSTTNSVAAFYLLPARAWEFGVGILLAPLAKPIKDRRYASFLGMTGLAMIAISVVCFTGATLFPGIAALLPVCGAAAIIWAGYESPTPVNRLLSQPVLVAVGLISYSLYLWHWPLLVFARVALPGGITTTVMASVLALSFFIAWLSYRFVESPWRRNGSIIASRRGVFIAGGSALALLAVTGYLIGPWALPDTAYMPPLAAQIALVSDENAARAGLCAASTGDVDQYSGICHVGGKSGVHQKPDFVLWGDSHADTLTPLMSKLGNDSGSQGVLFAQGDCPPLMGIILTRSIPGCTEHNVLALGYIRDRDVQKVIIVARWSYYVTGGPGESTPLLAADGTTAAHTPLEAARVLESSLERTVLQLIAEGREVSIMRQTPEQPSFDRRTAFYRAMRGSDVRTDGTPRAEDTAYQKLTNETLDRVAAATGAVLVDPEPYLCSSKRCDLWRDDTILYRDSNHLSIAGAMLLAPAFSALLRQ